VSRTQALVERRGEGVQDDFNVARTVEARAALLEVLLVQLDEVRDIAVVRHGDTDREGQVERLRVVLAAASDGGIAHMPHAEVAAQARHVLLVEDLEHQPESLLHVKRVGEGGDPRRVLPTVLHREESLVDFARDVDAVGPVDADEAAHVLVPP